MRYMKNLVYKIKFVIKNTIKKLPILIKAILSVLGVLLTVAECVYIMFDSKIVYDLMHENVFSILVLCVFGCFVATRTRLKYEYFIKGTDVKVALHVCDILQSNTAIVIPTNTTFDTIMEDEFISVNSVQGQFQKKYFDNNLSSLDELINKGLEGLEFELINRTSSKCKRYPLGTVSKITVSGQHFYFVAIADINQYGKTENTKFENVQLALEGIWNQLENKGHIENIAIPLLGTGKAGISDATRERVIKEIIFSFVAFSKERKITEKLLICIHPSDLEHNDLYLEEINEYLQYMCKYKYEDVSLKVEGTAV